MNKKIREQIVETSKTYFDIITEKIDEYGYDDDYINIENCCNSEQMKLLEDTIAKYLEESKTKQNTLLIVQVIVYLYFHLVLIETQDNDLLETSFILENRPKKVKEAFQELLRNIMFGDEPKYADVRKSFLAFNTKSFRDTLTPVSNKSPMSLRRSTRKRSTPGTTSQGLPQKRVRKGGKRHSRKRKSV